MDAIKHEMERQIIAKLDKEDPTNKDLGQVLGLIVEKMWSEERLANYIKTIHSAECASCKKAGSVKWYKRIIYALVGLVGTLVGLVKYYAGMGAAQ